MHLLNLYQQECQNKPDKISYGFMKKEYSIEKYLEYVPKPSYRSIITKFRLNAHRLRINSGAYENKGSPIPTELRTCMFCESNAVENESHFILECKKYENIRLDFIENFSNYHKNFSSLSIKEKTLIILNNQNKSTAHMVGKYLHEIYYLRNNGKQLSGSNQ